MKEIEAGFKVIFLAGIAQLFMIYMYLCKYKYSGTSVIQTPLIEVLS